MRVLLMALLVVGCGDSTQSNPDLSAVSDLSAAPDLSMAHGCNELVSCQANCPMATPSCNDACYNGTSASGKALLQTFLDCLANACTTTIVDGGGTACSTAEGTALQDPKNVGTVQLSPGCEACVRTAIMTGGACVTQVNACLADKS